MTQTEAFPPKLLSEPPEVRLDYFAGKVVAHPRLREAHQTLLNAIRHPAGASLVLVFGPTGVGKTTLRLRLEKQLIEEALPALETDPERIPVVGIEAVAPDSGQFNWKDYYTRALLALDEPLVRHKLDYGDRGLGRDRSGHLLVERVVASELRRAFEECLRHRRLSAFIVDEAQHLGKMTSGRRLLDQMDTLKSLAGMTDTVHVLVGTYELLGLANLSAQLSRRSVDIHFGRYRADSADILAFRSVLLTLQRHLPLPKEPDLVGRSEYLYEHSVGCVGVLKSWLNRALARALEEGDETLSARHLEQQAEPARKLLSLARAITEGEETLLEADRGQDELRTLLGLEAGTVQREASKQDATAERQSVGPNPRRRAGRIGERRPARDPIGESAPA